MKDEHKTKGQLVAELEEMRRQVTELRGRLRLLEGGDGVERMRAEQLLHAMNVAALAIRRALTPREIFTAVAKEFKKLGFHCTVFLMDESQSRLFAKYLSYETGALKAADKLTGLKAEGFSIPIKATGVYREVVWEERTVFVENTESHIRQVLPEPVERFTKQITRLLRIPRLIIAPLVVGDPIIGALTVQSDDLVEGDVPAVTAFAHQMAAAWHKAQLFEQAQQEIIERERAEKALRESEEKFRTIFETVVDMISYIDRRGKILDVNKRIEDLLGYKRDEIIGKGFSRFGSFGLKDLPRILDLFRNAIRKGKAGGMIELELEHKNGSQVFVEVGTRFIKKNAKTEGVVNVFRDITERKRAEDNIKHLYERVR